MGCDIGKSGFQLRRAARLWLCSIEKYDITEADPPGITVKYGETESLTPVFEPSPPVLIPKNSSSKVEREINCESAVSAPVAKGQVLGFVTAKLNGELLGRVNMVAPDAVGRLTFFKALFRLISSFSLF